MANSDDRRSSRRDRLEQVQRVSVSEKGNSIRQLTPETAADIYLKAATTHMLTPEEIQLLKHDLASEGSTAQVLKINDRLDVTPHLKSHHKKSPYAPKTGADVRQEMLNPYSLSYKRLQLAIAKNYADVEYEKQQLRYQQQQYDRLKGIIKAIVAAKAAQHFSSSEQAVLAQAEQVEEEAPIQAEETRAWVASIGKAVDLYHRTMDRQLADVSTQYQEIIESNLVPEFQRSELEQFIEDYKDGKVDAIKSNGNVLSDQQVEDYAEQLVDRLSPKEQPDGSTVSDFELDLRESIGDETPETIYQKVLQPVVESRAPVPTPEFNEKKQQDEKEVELQKQQVVEQHVNRLQVEQGAREHAVGFRFVMLEIKARSALLKGDGTIEERRDMMAVADRMGVSKQISANFVNSQTRLMNQMRDPSLSMVEEQLNAVNPNNEQQQINSTRTGSTLNNATFKLEKLQRVVSKNQQQEEEALENRTPTPLSTKPPLPGDH